MRLLGSIFEGFLTAIYIWVAVFLLILLFG